MRIALPLLFSILLLPSFPVQAESLPSCNPQVITHRGDRVTVSIDALSTLINQRLSASHSDFSDLQLSPVDTNHLKVSGKKNGTPMAISGPIHANNSGRIVLSADHITKNGSGEMMLMSLFGKTLSDYLNLKKTKNLSVQGNNLRVNPNGLLDLHGKLKAAQIKGSKIEMRFASAPCR
jgi:hypothetical protein